MIAAGSPREFSPLGRKAYNFHPGDVSLIGPGHLHPADKTRSIKTITTNKESWQLRESENDKCEEELYFKNKTVIHTRQGNGENVGLIKKCYTVESQVSAALWSKFHRTLNKCDDEKDIIKCISILTDDAIYVHEDTGQEYMATLQFPVQNVWNIKYGLLMERKINSKEGLCDGDNLPTIFSMTHPLDEIKPLVYKLGPQFPAQFFTDDNYEVVDTINNKNDTWVVLFHKTNGHSIWKCKFATNKDIEDVMGNSTNTGHMSGNCMSLGTPSGFQSSKSRSAGSPQVNLSSTPLFQRFSPMNQLQPPASPSHNVMAALSRCESPSLTCSPGMNLRFKEKLSLRSPTVSACDSYQYGDSIVEPAPLTPDVCLEHLWTEPLLMIDQARTRAKAKHVFLHEDFVGQLYICFLIQTDRVLKVSYSTK